MPACPHCGHDVAYVYDPDDELLIVERSEDGNLAIEGSVGVHLVAPGAGTYREHECSAEREAA